MRLQLGRFGRSTPVLPDVVLAAAANKTGRAYSPEPIRGLSPSRRRKAGDRRELIGVAVRPSPKENKGSAIGNDDIALLEQAVVHCDLRGDPLGLKIGRRFTLDAAMIFSGGGACGSDRC